MDDLLAAPAPIPLPPASIAVSDPAELIARRPDIRAAERRLAAANARVGVAEAARFPRLSFMGILGLGGTDPEDVFDVANLSTIALPRLQWSLLDFGRTAAAIDQAQAARGEADARYRDVVLRALQDAEQSLQRFGQHRINVAALTQISRQADTAAELNQQRFTAGAIGRSDLNLALRQRAQARANLSRAVAEMTTSWVAIQKSLGLGWRAEATPCARARLIAGSGRTGHSLPIFSRGASARYRAQRDRSPRRRRPVRGAPRSGRPRYPARRSGLRRVHVEEDPAPTAARLQGHPRISGRATPSWRHIAGCPHLAALGWKP